MIKNIFVGLAYFYCKCEANYEKYGSENRSWNCAQCRLQFCADTYSTIIAQNFI